MAAPFRGSRSDLTRQQLRAARFERLHRDVYVLTPAAVSLALRVDAALALFPDAIVSHRTAALLLGFPVADDGLVHVTRPDASAASERHGVRTHRAELPTWDVTTVDGRRVTRPARIYLDLAATLPQVELVVLADAVARGTGVAALERRLKRAYRVRGVRRARTALALADPLADSPAETRTRLILHGAGFSGLRHGVNVSDAHGGWLARPDLADEDAKVAIQYDGLVHLGDDPEQRRADIDRDELLRQQGWQVVVLTAVDLRNPHRMIEKVRAAYTRTSSGGLRPV
jgi:GNAT superfamily N-acetyltransferase